MCGRYALVLTTEEKRRQEKYLPEAILHNLYEPEWQKYQGYDVRPSTKRPVVVTNSTGPQLEPMRWGWQKRPWANKDHINARWENGSPKKMFAGALRERRCVIPATAYYEWERDEQDRPKAKFAFVENNRALLRMAGIWEESKSPKTMETENRFLIFTREMVLHEVLHDRTPVLLSPAAMKVWLDPRASEAELIEASTSMSDDRLTPYQVIRDAQAERDDSPTLLEPIQRT